MDHSWTLARLLLSHRRQDTTFAEARQQLTSAGEELTSAWDQFTSRVDC